VARWYERRLVHAGYARRDFDRFRDIRVATIVAGVAAAAAILWLRPMARIDIAKGSPFAALDFIFAAAAALAFFLGPEAALSVAVRRRQAAIAGDLPFVLDLIVLLAESGLAFDAALGRVVLEAGDDPRPLEQELATVRAELEHGVPRATAFRALADRVGIDELDAVTAAVVQGEALGGELVPILRAQADGLRSRRFEEARERAQRLPILMVFPLFTCVFPSLFIVALGPSMINAMQLIGALRRSIK
jgi:tight adherence protein C